MWDVAAGCLSENLNDEMGWDEVRLYIYFEFELLVY